MKSAFLRLPPDSLRFLEGRAVTQTDSHLCLPEPRTLRGAGTQSTAGDGVGSPLHWGLSLERDPTSVTAAAWSMSFPEGKRGSRVPARGGAGVTPMGDPGKNLHAPNAGQLSQEWSLWRVPRRHPTGAAQSWDPGQ